MSISQRNRVELGSLLSLWSIQLWISGPVFFSKHEVSPVQWPLDPIIKWMVTLDHPHHYCINEKMENNSNASHYWASHGPQMGNNVNDCSSPESWIESFFFLQIKTALSFLHAPVQVAKIKKTKNNTCWWDFVERRAPISQLTGMKTVQVLWKSAWCILKKLVVEEPLHNSAIPLLNIPKGFCILYRDTSSS